MKIISLTVKKTDIMAKKALKYGVILVAVVLVLGNSVYFKELDEVRAAAKAAKFDASAFAHDLWENELIPHLDKAIEADRLITLLATEPHQTFEKYSNALGIGSIRFFLIRGQGEAIAIDENHVTIGIGTEGRQVRVATEYIFGNAVRDASGLVSINEFTNTMDFNNVSAELNEIIRDEVLPSFKARIKQGDQVAFVGAIEMNRERMHLDRIEVIPISLEIKE